MPTSREVGFGLTSGRTVSLIHLCCNALLAVNRSFMFLVNSPVTMLMQSSETLRHAGSLNDTLHLYMFLKIS